MNYNPQDPDGTLATILALWLFGALTLIIMVVITALSA